MNSDIIRYFVFVIEFISGVSRKQITKVISYKLVVNKDFMYCCIFCMSSLKEDKF